jgi:hypothetical protein
MTNSVQTTKEPNLLDEPWLRRQVENHLVFGFFARRISFNWIIVPLLLLGVVSTLGESWALIAGRAAFVGLILWLLRSAFKKSLYHQAAVWWCAAKAGLAITSFLVLLMGGLVGFFRGQPDAIHLTLLALVWFPSIEFLPSMVERQRYITIGRILVSIPLVILGSRAGGWA